MIRKTLFAISALSLMLVLQSCSDDLTKKDIDVEVTLDTFNLVGSSNGNTARATVSGNPACSASNTSINALLAQADNYDDIDDALDSLDINSIRYRITRNDTAVAATGSMQMTDASTGNLKTIASVAIPANQLVSDWTKFPFVENGADIIEHYLDNLDQSFMYCAQGSPNSNELDMTLQLQLDLTATVDIL